MSASPLAGLNKQRDDFGILNRYAVPAIQAKLHEWGYDAAHPAYRHHWANAANNVTFLKLMRTPHLSARNIAKLQNWEMPEEIPAGDLQRICAIERDAPHRQHDAAFEAQRREGEPGWSALNERMHHYLGVLGLRAGGAGLQAEIKAKKITRTPD